MFKNAADSFLSHIIHNEVQEGKAGMASKKFRGARSCLPGCKTIGATAASTLRLIEDSGVERGGLACGDAWFGSVLSAVEAKKRLGVFTTMVVKGSTYGFPKAYLETLMYARHGYLNSDGEKRHRAGKHVVMTSEVAGVKVIAVAYTWSSTGIAYFVSTCGVTTAAAKPYVTSFEDESGEIVTKAFTRPQLVSDYYDACTVIDDHNKSRQAHLSLERKWPTKNCWLRLFITLFAMQVVSFFRIMSMVRPDEYEGLTVRQFVSKICESLKERPGYRPRKKAAKRGAEDTNLREVSALILFDAPMHSTIPMFANIVAMAHQTTSSATQ